MKLHKEIVQESIESMKLESAACRLLMKKLDTVKKALEKTVEKETAKRDQRVSELNEYKTEHEIQEAYGYAWITDKERRRLLEELEKGEKYVEETDTQASVALSLLRDFILQLLKQAESYEFELLPPEEKERRIAAQEELRQRVAQLRAARGLGNGSAE